MNRFSKVSRRVSIAILAGIAIYLSLGPPDFGDEPGKALIARIQSAPIGTAATPAASPAVHRPQTANSSRTTRTAHQSTIIRVPRAADHSHPVLRGAVLSAVESAGTPKGRSLRTRRARGTRRALASMELSGLLVRNGRSIDFPEVSHVPFRLRKLGVPVFNRTGRMHERDGQVVGHTGKLSIPPIVAGAITIDAETALERSREVIPGRGDRAPPEIERGLLALPGRSVPVWRVMLPVAEPIGTWLVSIDARDGSVVTRENLLRTVTGQGSTYLENIVTTPTPVNVPLEELDDSGFLSGRITQVFDVRELDAFRLDAAFLFDGADPRFVQTSVYRGLTDAARFAEAHGAPLFSEPILGFTNLSGGPNDEQFNNAFYDPFFPFFGFGNGDGIITANLGTDLDVAIHEMGHHIFLSLVDPVGSSSVRSLDAINEGFADSLAGFVTQDPEIGESTLPGRPFLRNLNNSATWPDGIDPDPHIEGLIFGGLNWDLANALGIDLAARIVINGLPFLDPDADFPAQEYREALVMGEQVTSFGVNRATVEAASLNRGIEALDSLGVDGFLDEGVPRGATLSDGEFRVYFFSEFPDSPEIRINLTGSGDADLLVGPLATLDFNDPSTFLFSGSASSNEFIQVTRLTTPSVDDDDLWFVGVEDFVDGAPSSFQVVVTSDPPAPTISIGGSAVGSIDVGGEFDLFTFQASAGDIVRLEGIALNEELDPVVSIFDPSGIEIFGADDDSGEGTDALIQGAQLPTSQIYGIAVFSLIADIDPSVGTGDYRLELSLCENVGPDFDGDGLADVCDDDDDNDGFIDALDSAPVDALRCQDIEGDGCDDCVSGDFAPFDDGPNADGDHLCDDGDADDDNDGCVDEIDPFPFTASIDDDVDLVGDDCDNCLDLHNPGQLDFDADGLGDDCDPTPMPEPDGTVSVLAVLGCLVGLHRFRLRAD